MTERVRARSTPYLGPKRAVFGAGRVATEWREEIDPLGEGSRSLLSTEASDGVRNRKDCVMYPGESAPTPALTGDASSCALAVAGSTASGGRVVGFRDECRD